MFHKETTPAPIAVVTGATGFVGYVLTRLLVKEGLRVRVISRERYQIRFKNIVDQSEWFTSELFDDENLILALQGANLVYHLAGISNSASQDNEKLFKVNALGTKNLFEISKVCGVSKYIYFSSIQASYPEESAYSASKKAAENILINGSKNSPNIKVLILRIANVYGPGMSGTLRDLIKYTACQFSPLLPELKNDLMLVSVTDLSIISVKLGKRDEYRTDLEIYYVTDGLKYSVNQIQEMTIKSTGLRKFSWHIPKTVLIGFALTIRFFGFIRLIDKAVSKKISRLFLNDQAISQLDPNIPRLEFIPTCSLESEIPDIISVLKEAIDAETR